MEPENLHELLRKEFQGETLNDSDLQILSSWKSEHVNDYQQYKRIWDDSSLLTLKSNTNIDQQWDDWNKGKQGRPAHTWYAVAAVVALLIVSSVLFFINRQPTDFSTLGLDAPSSFELPDGSIVWLNKNSELALASDFNEENRKVSLKGEAFFEVFSNKEKPFIVENTHSNITVLGTEFNAVSNDSINTVQLLEGSVAFLDDNGHSETLQPGEQILLSNNSRILKSTFDNQNFLSWKTGELRFENTPISLVLIDLEKYYEIDIILENNTLENCRVTLTFNQVPLEEALEELAFLLDLEYRIDKNNVYINGNGCE